MNAVLPRPLAPLVVVVAAACGAPERVAEAPPAAVWAEARKVASGTPVRVHAPEGSTVESSEPELVPTQVDGTTWDVSGPDGSYIVSVTPPAGAAVRLFLDVGVDGPTGGEMADLAPLPDPPPSMLPWVAAGLVGLAAVVVGGRRLVRALEKPLPPPIPDPPHIVAQRAWAALRQRADLADEAIAAEMSTIFRAWISATLEFPAEQRTTREILDNLAGTFTAAELDAARRLLMATDLVRFADRSERPNLFTKLDGDFGLVVTPRARRGAHA